MRFRTVLSAACVAIGLAVIANSNSALPIWQVC
jgi:hypothetical protein